MLDIQNILKFRILTCLLMSSPTLCTVTGISRTLKEEKYVISRAMIKMEQEGLVDRSDVRAPMLTELGKKKAEAYQERLIIAQNYLLYEGEEVENARRDATVLAMYGSDELMTIIRGTIEPKRVKHELRQTASFSGTVFCKKLKDGIYNFPFLIYREHVNNNSNISMANRGFERPCSLIVDNGVGTIQLVAKSMSEYSQLNGERLYGHINRMEYFDSGQFIGAEFHGNVISFTASALNFENLGDGAGQILHGSVCLKMQCTCGTVHMPESKAIFTILI